MISGWKVDLALSTTDPAYLSEVQQMLDSRGEILVETCYSHAAGSRDYALVKSLSTFQDWLKGLSARTLVNVYRHYDLPLRGVVSESLIGDALDIRSSDEGLFLIVYRQPRQDWRLAAEYEEAGGWLASFCEYEGKSELEDGLRGSLGELVAIGPKPDWGEQYSNILWAVAPNSEGVVQIGVY